jgi:hypothetical protein
MCTIPPALDVKFCVDPAIHSLMKPGMWACYMQLALYSQYWFTFLSSIAFLPSTLWAISKWPTGLISEMVDPNGHVSFGSNYSITLLTEGLRHSPSSVKIS